MKIPIIYALYLAILVNCSSLYAEPLPGDIFREYTWISWNGVWGVLDPTFFSTPDVTGSFAIDDLQDAVRAEAYLELWNASGGTGLSKQLHLNGGDWIQIPEPDAIPGDAGHPRSPALPECYTYFAHPSVAVPLEQLVEGRNTFGFAVGQLTDCGTTADSFWGLYSVTLRVYYATSKPHATGRIISPVDGRAVGDFARLKAAVSSPNSSIQQVDFIGYYEDFDYEGNGIYRQWHYNHQFGKIKRHLGTAKQAPYSVVWNTEWVPDQEEPMQIMAWITDAEGLCYATPAVGGIALHRPDRSVKLYKPYDVPAWWLISDHEAVHNRRESSKVFVPHDLRRAKAAHMALSTWNGFQADAIGVNDSMAVKRVGIRYDEYSNDEVPVPLAYIRPGTNTLYTLTFVEREGGVRVFWPGIALKVQYEGLVENASAPAGDLSIYADGLAVDWRIHNKGESSETHRADLDLAADALTYQGDQTIGVQSKSTLWKLDFIPEVTQGIAGYTALHFAFYPSDLTRSVQDAFSLHINDRRLSLLKDDHFRVDLASREWQVVEVALDTFELRFPYIESLALSGNFKGDFYIDDVRLVAAPEPTPTAIAEERITTLPQTVGLEQNVPNPFNSGTVIPFVLPESAEIVLSIYNLMGQKVATLVEDAPTAGAHAVHWDGRDDRGRKLASGVYLYRLRAGAQVETRRLLLIR